MTKQASKKDVEESKKKAKQEAEAKAKREADEKVKKEADAKKKEGFLADISVKISAAKSIADLEALNVEVFNIWADDVPVEIQILAAKKGEEISSALKPNGDISEKESTDPVGWKKVSPEEVKEAEKAGKLAGYNPDTGFALINK